MAFRSWLLCGAIGWAFSYLLGGEPAIASSVLQVSVEKATGILGEPVRVELMPGVGANISLLPTGEKIEKVWLDNPNFVALDVDGCLKGLGQDKCEGAEARIVHLKLIEGVEFKGLPSAPSSLLTIVARGEAGRKVYLFEVFAVDSSIHYTIEVVNTSIASERGARVTPVTTIQTIIPASIDLKLVEQGVSVAVKRQLLVIGSPLWNRISDFIARVKAGQEGQRAARGAGISLELVNKLQTLGRPEAYPNPTIGVKNSI